MSLTKWRRARKTWIVQLTWAIALAGSLIVNIMGEEQIAIAQTNPCEPSPPPSPPAPPPTQPADIYSTTFPNTQNPLDEGGVWTQGGTHGRAWQNMLSQGGSPGTAYGAGPSEGYNDNLAFIQYRFSPTRHFAEIVVRRDANYAPPSTHEIEIHVGGTLTANHYQGYEMLWNIGGSLQPVRLNGSVGNFSTDVFTVVWGNFFTVANNDRVRVEFDSTSGNPIITVYKNGAKQIVLTDRTSGHILSGSPGIGAFARSGSGLDMKRFAIKEFKAGNL